jgi:hypothetical protein
LGLPGMEKPATQIGDRLTIEVAGQMEVRVEVS